MKALKIIPLTQEDQLRKEVMQSSALRAGFVQSLAHCGCLRPVHIGVHSEPVEPPEHPAGGSCVHWARRPHRVRASA